MGLRRRSGRRRSRPLLLQQGLHLLLKGLRDLDRITNGAATSGTVRRELGNQSTTTSTTQHPEQTVHRIPGRRPNVSSALAATGMRTCRYDAERRLRPRLARHPAWQTSPSALSRPDRRITGGPGRRGEDSARAPERTICRSSGQDGWPLDSVGPGERLRQRKKEAAGPALRRLRSRTAWRRGRDRSGYERTVDHPDRLGGFRDAQIAAPTAAAIAASTRASGRLRLIS